MVAQALQAGIASNSLRVAAVFLYGRSPRLTAARRPRDNNSRTAGVSQGLAALRRVWALDSTATPWTTVLSRKAPGRCLILAATGATLTLPDFASGQLAVISASTKEISLSTPCAGARRQAVNRHPLGHERGLRLSTSAGQTAR